MQIQTSGRDELKAPDGFARMQALTHKELLSFLAPVRDGAELPE
jgi:hypothetical protein